MQRFLISSLTALLVFCISYLACWVQMGYVHRMGPSYKSVRYQIMQVHDALYVYYKLRGTYPDTLEELLEIQSPEIYIEKTLFNDWWGHPFQYRKTIDNYEITSLGRDGNPGGVGLDTDVSFGNDMRLAYRGTSEFGGHDPSGYNSIRLPISQFIFDTPHSDIIFTMAIIASFLAGGIWYTPGHARSISNQTLAKNVAITTISAVVFACAMAFLYVMSSHIGH